MAALVSGKVVALRDAPESPERSERRSAPAGKVGALAAHEPIPARSIFMLDFFALGEKTIPLVLYSHDQ